MKSAEPKSSLKNVPLFYSLNTEELSNIQKKIAIKRYRKNQIIMPEEDTNEYMYIIIFGKVKVYQTSIEGREIILAMHKSGDYFGEMSLLDGKTVPATVQAVQDTLTAIISKKDFYALIRRHRTVLNNLLSILCSRLRESWFRMRILSFDTASQRIKGLLFMLMSDYGESTEEGIILNLKLTHQEIADMTGLSRETVTRIINRWQKSELISIMKKRYIRLNKEFLKRNQEIRGAVTRLS
jgi:CRP/FNR family transcriptional regulator